MSPWKHSIKQQTIPVWNTLKRNNFNNSVFHFWIQCSIDLPEWIFGIVNHDGLSIVNQLKKTTHELLFIKRKWVKSFSCGCANLANCIRKCRLDLGCLVFTQKESQLPFLTNWEVLLRGVLQTFVLGQRGFEPINVVSCQFWFFIHHGFDMMGLLLGFTHMEVVWAV